MENTCFSPSQALSRIKMKAEQLGDELAKAGGSRHPQDVIMFHRTSIRIKQFLNFYHQFTACGWYESNS